jgi:hypothetical protein
MIFWSVALDNVMDLLCEPSRPRSLDATDVRFGSLADIEAAQSDVCFTPKSGHSLSALGCLALCQKRTSHQIQRPEDLTGACLDQNLIA